MAGTGKRATLFLPERVYDFGSMDQLAEGSHDFEFHNVGNQPLTITKGTTSCKCMVHDFESAEIPPGRSIKIRVAWHAREYQGSYHQTASFSTTDPDRETVTVVIKGLLSTSIKAVPADLTFASLPLGDSRTHTISVLGYRKTPLEITGWKLEDPTTAEFFGVSYDPLSAGEVASHEDATSGHRVQVQVKSGLPLGAFQQKIILSTDSPEVPSFKIPIRGTIVSDVTVYGVRWEKETGVLRLGSIDPAVGVEQVVFLRVGGLEKPVEVKPVDIQPSDVLSVTVGKVGAMESGMAVVVPVTIKVPKGSRPANYLGPDEANYGRVLLETNHPSARNVKILVQFAVKG